MRSLLKVRLLGLFIALFGISNSNAQVMIGSNEDPESGALLQLKNKTVVVDGGTNADKGFILPRVELTALDVLTVMDAPTDADKLNHRGTLVYNMTVDDDASLEEGIYKWDGEKWSSIQSTSVTNAVFTISNCGDIIFSGAYYNDQALNNGNFIKLTLDVTKPGYYNFFAQPDSDNGYYFLASGEFMTTGQFEVYLMGAGTPATPTPTGDNGDEVFIYSNGEKVEPTAGNYCSAFLKIGDSTVRPKYAMVCNSVQVNGIYKKDTELNNSNTITLRINVSAGSQGSEYHIWTDEVEGISFEGTGVLGAAGPQNITLYGKGACENTTHKEMTIYINSESNQATCTATIVPVISEKKIVEYAYLSGTEYGLASGGDWGPKAMLNDNMNFGDNENSIVKYLGFSQITHIAEGLMTDASLRDYTGVTAGVEPADMIIITYNASPASSTQVNLLVDYVNKGGILIYMDQSNDIYHQELLSKIFGESVTASNFVSIGTTASYAVKMNSNVDDEIINGPFGDCRPYQWGDDLANTLGLTFVPREAIVYAGSVVARTGLISSSGVQVSMMKHKTKNFFWFGDSGFISSGGQNWTGVTENPFKVASATFNGVTYPKYPALKSHGTTTALPVCNSMFFANLMAWAVKTAEESGINSGK